MKNKLSKTLATISALAMISSTVMCFPAFAEDELVDTNAIVQDELSEPDAASYTAAQQAAYNKITASCSEFLSSSVSLSTDAFKIITLDSKLTKSEIDAVAANIKKANPVLDRVAVYSSSSNSSYDKIVLFTKSAYRTPAGREAIKALIKPTVTAQAGNAQVKLTWTSVSGASSYRVWKVVDGQFVRVGDYTGTTATVTGLTNGKKTGFLVRACVNGTYTDYTSADIVYATPKASAVKVTAIAGNSKVNLYWSTYSGASSYRVWKIVDGQYIRVGDFTNYSTVITGLTNGKKVGFLVRACVNGTYTDYTTADIVYATPNA